MAGGDSQSRIKDGTKYRVAGSRPGRAKNWYSENTYSVSHAHLVLNVARTTATLGEKFWVERYRNGRWERAYT